MGCGCGQKKTIQLFGSSDPCLSTRLHPHDHTILIQVTCPQQHPSQDNNGNPNGDDSEQESGGINYNPNEHQ